MSFILNPIIRLHLNNSELLNIPGRTTKLPFEHFKKYTDIKAGVVEDYLFLVPQRFYGKCDERLYNFKKFR
jgi:hypothetical protein